MLIKVLNRSTGVVCYELPELNVRRVFNINETKNIEDTELEALSQTDSGLLILQHMLLVDNKGWVQDHFDAPIEYWWTPEKVRDCLLNDELDLFAETLDYAPEGVLDFIKMFAWQLPLKDLNKIQILKDKTGFDTMAAIEVMKQDDEHPEETKKTQRLRREEA